MNDKYKTKQSQVHIKYKKISTESTEYLVNITMLYWFLWSITISLMEVSVTGNSLCVRGTW